jgi:response regulator NasT
MNRSLRIVVADDEPDMQDFFRRMLPLLGHQVVGIAGNGRELVEQCRVRQPDLVITDVKMPEMDGIAASAELCRENPLPVILISAYHHVDLVDHAVHDHVMAYLVKPVGRKDLEPAIALAVRRFEEFRQLRDGAADSR